jgi:hypothetical protein
MKRQYSSPTKISNAILASRYLALQALREKVRKAEERFASRHPNGSSILQLAATSDTRMRPKARKQKQ